MGWQVYAVSRRTLSVGASALNVSLIGLVTFIPLLLLALPAGATADRYDRRSILLACYVGELVAVGILIWAAFTGHASVPLLLGVAVLFGTSRSFFGPASGALGPMLVPRHLLPRAIAFNSLAWQSASIAGPAAAGLLIAISPGAAYATVLGVYLAAVFCLAVIRRSTRPAEPTASRVEMVKEGLAYVWEKKIIFGAISLDLAAVILGGADGSPAGLRQGRAARRRGGFRPAARAGPAIGATLIGVYLARRPINAPAGGWVMFRGVGVFGATTVVFGVSKSLWLSVAALAVLGAADIAQRLHPQHSRSAYDAGRHARSGRRGLRTFRRGVERAWRVRKRHRREVAGRGGGRGIRRRRGPSGDRSVGLDVSGLAQGRQPRIIQSQRQAIIHEETPPWAFLTARSCW